MKVYDAVYRPPKGDEIVVPVAARSLVHAARKAAAVEDAKGELISITLTERIII